MFRATGRPTIFSWVCVGTWTPWNFAGLEVAFLGMFALSSKESRFGGGRRLHGLYQGLLLSRTDNVHNLIGRDLVVWDVSNGLFEVVRETGADEDCNVGVW